MRTIIHVNRHHIAANARDGGKRPVYSVKQGNRTRYATEIVLEGPVVCIYRPEKPLPCGAKAWLETEGEVFLKDEMTFQEAKDAT